MTDPGMRRPVVMALASHYLPGYKAGGPIRSIRNLVHALRHDCDFRIVTSDRDHTDTRPFADVGINAWNDADGARVFYADRQHRGAAAIAALIRDTDPDLVYLNTFFSPAFGVGPLVQRRLGRTGDRPRWIVAPRGEFATGAMALKPVKKRTYLRAAKVAGLLRGITWQATSEHEVEDIRRATGAADSAIMLAANITEEVRDLDESAAIASADAPLRLCFVSRVSPMKNLVFAIEALARVRHPVELDIYGPVDDETHAAACRRAAASAADRLTVRWHGHVPHEEVRGIFARHDLFLFPTRGENFGHVIFESLAAGTPVLVSDRTPWQDLDAAGVGWVRSLDRMQDFVDVIDRFAMLPPDERLAMRRRAHAHARVVHHTSPAVEQTRRLLLGTSRPR
jgi:glycosyltransferase involved in cell wall biosynthesis